MRTLRSVDDDQHSQLAAFLRNVAVVNYGAVGVGVRRLKIFGSKIDESTLAAKTEDQREMIIIAYCINSRLDRIRVKLVPMGGGLIGVISMGVTGVGD